jgi:signal transduction histidine kinase
MKLTRIQLRILASFFVALLVLTTGWVGAGALSSAMATRDRARRSRQVADAVDDLRVNILESEAAERGYLLTTNKAYLETYRSARERADLIAHLRTAFGEDLGASDAFDQLAEDLDAKRAEMAATIRTADEQGIPAALTKFGDGNGERLASAIRVDLDVILRREKQAREPLVAKTEAKLQLARIVVLSGTLLAFALAVIVNLSLMSALKAREVAQKIVEQQSRQLRAQTESLLAHEKQLGEQLAKQQELGVALQRSNEELDQFAYATSHDLKAPLRGIMNLATFIEEDLGPGILPEVKQNLETLRGRAHRLELLIQGILDYSRAGRARAPLEQVDTGALAREIAELIAPPPGCTIAVEDGMPTLDTERAPLQQVFMNLIQNAVKHGCPQGRGHIQIGYRSDASPGTFYVRDQGPGIAAEYHDRIFGIFQTLAPRDQVEGAGIGLAVVKKLVESRGGQVVLGSSAGNGATFEFSWPANSPRDA